jgi:hypothetical protein
MEILRWSFCVQSCLRADEGIHKLFANLANNAMNHVAVDALDARAAILCLATQSRERVTKLTTKFAGGLEAGPRGILWRA